MHIENEALTDSYHSVDKQCKELSHQLLHDWAAPQNNTIEFNELEDLYAESELKDSLFVIEHGYITCKHEDRILFHLDEGDIIGIPNQYGLLDVTWCSSTYVEVRPISFEDFKTHVDTNAERGELWTRCLIAEAARLALLVGQLNRPENRATLGFKNFKADEVIIEENTAADEVYAIVEGHADVFVNEVRVGEVLEDEIFGALALLTDSPRTATVIASRPSLVLVVPKHQFKTLMETHPHICMNLMENMARQIVSLNNKVHTLENTQHVKS